MSLEIKSDWNTLHIDAIWMTEQKFEAAKKHVENNYIDYAPELKVQLIMAFVNAASHSMSDVYRVVIAQET
tara:strand:+ start:69 stop:281 length:213 start_codon:yes stop_codon:yes gene_type:complete